ncbi:MAG TPA: bifunctional uridylyltransferase/uridylyl-removing protein, partial [Erythrobacter sp.]|nr:bifunctional uridylyltransferase/uridylyl-removing protein [Erythrobacter sp.]
AQMQFDMYHHYTVDEHTIRAIGLLNQIEKGELADDHPRATRLIHKVGSRRTAYVAALLHDIAKGRGGDHSVLGAEVAEDLCPRFGLSPSETEMVAWLVRNHLLMSHTAQKRDLTDPKTIEDFVALVQSQERLRHLAILTAVDIRAVGPGTWNSWKGQLLGELYDVSSERLRLGHMRHGREQKMAYKQQEVAKLLGEDAALVDELAKTMGDAYWIAEPTDIIALNLVHYAAARAAEHELSIHCEYYEARGATLVTVIAADHPGLFYRIAGGIHLAGGNIIDARIHTTRKGWALDNFLVQDPHGEPFAEAGQLDRLKKSIADALANKVDLAPRLAQRPLPHSRARAFDVAPRVLFDNKASNKFTVIEVNARDRSALLNRLARALFESRLVVHSAHVTNYGERAADTFYVTDLTGGKLQPGDRMNRIEARLMEAASDATQDRLENA